MLLSAVQHGKWSSSCEEIAAMVMAFHQLIMQDSGFHHVVMLLPSFSDIHLPAMNRENPVRSLSNTPSPIPFQPE